MKQKKKTGKGGFIKNRLSAFSVVLSNVNTQSSVNEIYLCGLMYAFNCLCLYGFSDFNGLSNTKCSQVFYFCNPNLNKNIEDKIYYLTICPMNMSYRYFVMDTMLPWIPEATDVLASFRIILYKILKDFGLSCHPWYPKTKLTNCIFMEED